MKRWEAVEFGEPEEVLQLREVDLPEPGPGEARVRVVAASITLPDLMMVRGQYPLTSAPPVSPGQEVVGVVEATTEQFPFPVGTRIAGNARFDAGTGGLAEHTIVPGWSAMPVPAGLTDEQTVGFPGSFHVAHIGLHHRARLQPDETVLVLGGAGRTGSAAIQIGKALGARVIATARTDEKARFCREQGADHVVDPARESLTDAVSSKTGGRGVDVVYDTVGGRLHTEGVGTLRSPGGRVLLVGFASGSWPNLDAKDVLFRDYTVAGAISSFRSSDEREATAVTLSAMLRAGQLAPPVTAVFDFADVPDAVARRGEHGLGQFVVLVDRSPR